MEEREAVTISEGGGEENVPQRTHPSHMCCRVKSVPVNGLLETNVSTFFREIGRQQGK